MQISVRLNLTKTIIVTAVRRLVKRGYMKREQNSRDGREQLLMLTDLWEQVNKEHNQNDFLFKEQLTKKEYVQSGGLSKKAMYYQADLAVITFILQSRNWYWIRRKECFCYKRIIKNEINIAIKEKLEYDKNRAVSCRRARFFDSTYEGDFYKWIS